MGKGDRERLARAFGIDPIPLGGIAIGSGAMTVMLISSPVLAAAPWVIVAPLIAVEQHRIAVGLREVRTWGFPVEGYRAWLLASEPAFDLELRGEVGSELVEQALAAVDPAIVVERRGARMVRVVVPRVRIPLERGGDVVVGDRRLLAAIRERVLGPLHAEVGIAAMRMGDRTTLGALVAAATPVRDAGFRDPALQAPAALQALVHAGTADPQPRRETAALALRADRVLHAAGKARTPAGLALVAGVATTILGGALAGAAGGWIGAGIGFLAGLLGIVGRDRQRARAVKPSLGEVPIPVPVEGYSDWLLSGRPILDLELAAPVPRDWVAERLRPLPAQVTWIDDALLRIETPPRRVVPGDGVPAFWGGDPAMLRAIAVALLVPLHDRVGIAAMRMGGFVDRRE